MAVRTRRLRTLPAPAAAMLDRVPASAPVSFIFPFRLLAVLTVLPVLLAFSLIVAYREHQSDRIYPGISVFGLDVGRMTPDQAMAAIKQHVQEQARRPFVLRSEDDAFTVSLAGLGLRIDDAQIEEWANRAWEVGRVDGISPWLRAQVTLLRHGFGLPVSIGFERDRAVAVLGRIALEVEHPTVNASISVERAGERFEIHTTPARTGRRLNVDATLERLQQALVGQIPQSLGLVIDEAPPGIADADLLPVAEAIQIILGSPLVFTDGARTWPLTPSVAHEMLEINGLDTGHPPITATLNGAKLREFVERTARAADQPARNPSFDVEDGQVVIRPGSNGRLVDADATFELAREKVTSRERMVELVFVEDKPWLTEADLQPARTLANAALDLPITIEAPEPPGSSGTAGVPAPAGTEERKWVLDRALLSQMLVLPNTQALPRDYASLPAGARPPIEIALDSGKVTNFLAREIAPWVSEDPVDAALQFRTTVIEVPNPAYAAAVAAEERRLADLAAAASRAAAIATPGATPGAIPGATPGATPRATALPTAAPTPVPTPQRQPITVPPTLRETRYTVEIRSAREGRGPDYLGTFGAMQVLFRSGLPADPEARRVTLRYAPRPPRVEDRHLIAARDLANRLIGEPVIVRWQDVSWTVTHEELVNMLRYQGDGSGVTAYLTRDGLMAKATAIAREAERLAEVPVDLEGQPLPVDVAGTAGAIWQAASTVATNRVVEVVWNDERLRQQRHAAAVAAAEAEYAAAVATATAQALAAPSSR